MQYIVVFSGLVTIIVGLIAAYQFIKSIQHRIARRPGAILGVITVILIVLTVVLANSPFSREGGALTLTPNTDQSGVTTTATQQIPSSTPTTVPTTTSLAPGVLYEENGSDGWQGWALSPDWKTVENNKLLINDGSHANNFLGPTAIAPYTIPNSVQNFAIETTITSPQPQSDTHFSITACGSTADSGWQGYEVLFAYVYSGSHEVQIFANRDRLATANFDPGTNQHNYRLEVKGNVITVFIDHAQVAQATDNKFLTCGRQVGLLSSLVVLRVSSFKITAL